MQISTKALREELAWCQRFIETKSTIPILQNVLFEAVGGTLKLTATDLEVAGITTVKGSGKGKWACTAPVKKMIQYLAKVDEEAVNLSATDNHWLVIAHGTAKTQTAGMSMGSYPTLPAAPEALATLRGFALAIKRVLFCVSKEESRFTLNGALLEVDGDGARMVATDGHRLSVAPLKVTGVDRPSVLFPKNALIEAGRFEEDCTLSTDEDHIFLDFGQRRIVTRKLTGNFPDWRRACKDDYPGHCMIPVASTLKVLNRVALYADERSHCVQFTLESGALKVFASTVEDGEAQGTVPVQLAEGPPLTIGLNADYVTDFLTRTGAQNVGFCYTDGKSNVQFVVGDTWRYVVMSMKI
jgi:DNA polymerase-3 subunit beta